GTVKATNLFEVERYETLLQMISIVTGSLKKDIGVYDLLKAIFPSGSVTGAPKINTMGLINSLEEENRNVYTGGVGFFAPGGKAVFNVAIRTVLIDQRTKEGEMGIGSGIVYDSNSYKEFEECKLKANFITQQTKHFKLIETLLYKPGKGYFLLRYHMDRLLESAEYFNFRCDKRYVARELNKLKRCFKGKSSYRVRLLLDKGGKVELEYTPIASSYKDEALPKVKFSSQKSFSSDIFLYHKTTERKLYDDEYKKWRKRGYFDIIFTNEKKQVTEGAISNIVIKKDRTYYTPPLDAGLLNGVCRRALFKKKKISLKEKMLYKKDICEADELYMINSVRGMVRVRI
ncbi:MAG: aminotransferase class IV, partial [Candidatus Omnitrophota bacterium]|nr:aminotransferase class IV [Candidatus Omnitrophota bacterium]